MLMATPGGGHLVASQSRPRRPSRRSGGKEEQVAAFLAGALPAAQAEAFTPAWFALRASHDVFYIVDAFARLDRCQPIVGGRSWRAFATQLFASGAR